MSLRKVNASSLVLKTCNNIKSHWNLIQDKRSFLLSVFPLKWLSIHVLEIFFLSNLGSFFTHLYMTPVLPIIITGSNLKENKPRSVLLAPPAENICEGLWCVLYWLIIYSCSSLLKSWLWEWRVLSYLGLRPIYFKY